mgnify:CR=1 FL=1|tara:strand:+ start:59 stop:394 length:336 start_codon:yes stop_codon:yes gene_type:complete
MSTPEEAKQRREAILQKIENRLRQVTPSTVYTQQEVLDVLKESFQEEIARAIIVQLNLQTVLQIRQLSNQDIDTLVEPITPEHKKALKEARDKINNKFTVNMNVNPYLVDI